MQTEINLKTSELNAEFLSRIKNYLKVKKNANIKIIINDEEDYFEVLDRSIKDIENKKGLVTFSLEELMAFDPGKVK